jgi:hypothetical protein
VTLGALCFKTEVGDDEELHRVVVATLLIAPFTLAHADDLNMRTLLYDSSTGTPKEAIESLVVHIAVPDQQLALARIPGADPFLVLPCVAVEDKLRVRLKHDRDPIACEATIRVSCLYPHADALLALASVVNDTLYCTFTSVQLDLLTAEDDAEPIRHIERGGDRAH